MNKSLNTLLKETNVVVAISELRQERKFKNVTAESRKAKGNQDTAFEVQPLNHFKIEVTLEHALLSFEVFTSIFF